MNLKSMSNTHIWKVLLTAGMLLSGSVVLMLSCSSDSITDPTRSRAWYYASEFKNSPGLSARPDQVVIFDVPPGEALSQHEIPYQYADGGYLFAIPWDDPFITSAEILDRSGGLIATVERGDGGVYLDMASGDYRLKVYHDGQNVPEMGSVAFIYQQMAKEPESGGEVQESGNGDAKRPLFPVYPVFGSLYFVPISAHPQRFNLVAVHDVVKHSSQDLTLDVLKGITTNPESPVLKERRHLFSFEKVESGPETADEGYDDSYGTYVFHSWVFPDKTFYSGIWDCRIDDFYCPPSQGGSPIPDHVIMPMYVESDETHPVNIYGYDYDDDFTFQCRVRDYGRSYVYLDVEDDATYNDYLYFSEFSGEGDSYFSLDHTFRFYKDGSLISKQERRALKTGEVALFEGENYTGVAVILSASFKDTALIPLKQVKSVAFGLYTTTTVQFYSGPDFGGELIRTVGVDMPEGLDISGPHMGSVKVYTDGRTILLNSKKCPYCNLAGVDLSNLSLDDADLFNADLMAADIHHTRFKQANLAGALLNGANLTNANLSGASLLGASLNAYAPLNLGAAVLSGAYLRNANCKGADLGGVNFENASFHTWGLSYNQGGCDQDTDNPPFTKDCASAEGANMDGAVFSNAYLAGTDFSGVTATGAIFSNAVLTGAIFRGAHLDRPGSSGRGVTFKQAFIGGADFADATVEGANFTDAYVNCPSNGCVRFKIPDTHTHFPGFDDIYGMSPCVEFAYTQGTVVPRTRNDNTCPDGGNGPCGDDCNQGTWNNPNTDRHDPSNPPNSDCTDMPDHCTEIDYTW